MKTDGWFWESLGAIEFVPTIFAIAAGAAIAWIFCASLWRTANALPASQNPAAMFALSALLRVSLATGAFVLVTHLAGWVSLIIAMMAFVLTRNLYTRRRLAMSSERRGRLHPGNEEGVR